MINKPQGIGSTLLRCKARRASRNVLRWLLALALTAPAIAYADTEGVSDLGIAENCVSAEDPKGCMESFGYQCHQSRSMARSLEAQHLGCNRPLGDGRIHFAQMTYDAGNWVIENQ
ncbi:MAG: hypothetical protein AAGA95_22200, partial [Pseudomonadota bacterium]